MRLPTELREKGERKGREGGRERVSSFTSGRKERKREEVQG